MTKENTIQLMECKLRAYKNGYLKAIAKRDGIAAEKWKDGCKAIYERIDKLKKVDR